MEITQCECAAQGPRLLLLLLHMPLLLQNGTFLPPDGPHVTLSMRRFPALLSLAMAVVSPCAGATAVCTTSRNHSMLGLVGVIEEH